MKQFDIIYDFGVLEVIQKSWFITIPVFLYWIAVNRLRNDEDEDEDEDEDKEGNLIQNLLSQSKSLDTTKAQIIKYTSIIIFAFLVIIQTIKIYRTYSILNTGLKSIEGYVTDFHGMPSSGHDSESFNVRNVKFKFSDFDLTDFGYNNAKSKGGVIDENVYVRLKYYQSKDRNVILRLEKRK
ncbi:hypothetical protein L1276_003977 [Flavobacterium sp. HSC-32F16]|uniref:hypothetical protein n=1 Tax=Flavobacterium sp. HSC-32F16 TaxID=2910964 RepID=UPI0020A29CCC|nr:hypothetical protein [Flavobacterium sp. HSC-32F16]MCP2028806.1 hypothetical protein [Flavobacterium sp. HSC-32F16]